MKLLQFKNNNIMPAIGLGTWKATGNDVKNAVKKAIREGYRHIDTAAIYSNEVEIGEALAEVFAEGNILREEVFITSKLWNDSHGDNEVLPALKDSLKRLQLDYLDLYLIHWPVVFKHGVLFSNKPEDYISLQDCPIIDTWRQMEACKEKGYAKHIGVSNFSKKKLIDLLSKAQHKPEVNQVELHPFLQQNELLEYCNKEEIILTAYSPLGSGDRAIEMKADNEPDLLNNDIILNIAKNKDTSTAQVLIAWHLHRGCSVIPKSTSNKHIESNLQAAALTLNEKDLERIASLDRQYRYVTGKFFEMPERGYNNIYDE
jgi:alcohol dehydrogenase (NADP+)